MTWYTGLGFGLWSTFLVLPFAVRPGKLRPVRLATNYRGRQVPLSLGVALAVGYGVPAMLAGLLWADGAVAEDWLWLFLAMALVFAAGVYDDRQEGRAHGLRTHFGELGRGRVTSGIVKMVAALAAAAIAALTSGLTGIGLAVGIALMAGVTNLFNLLDVTPGRALKSGFCLGLVLLILHPSSLAWATVGQTAALLPADVRERGMLGDAGSNLLGFVLGFLVVVRLSVPGMWGGLLVVVALHAVAETVTLTRVIRAVPPLRWVDDLWRIPAADPTMN
jgi:hypothetical protein